jgi:hypothetical protein
MRVARLRARNSQRTRRKAANERADKRRWIGWLHFQQQVRKQTSDGELRLILFASTSRIMPPVCASSAMCMPISRVRPATLWAITPC